MLLFTEDSLVLRGELSLFHYVIILIKWLPCEKLLQHFLHSCRISDLSIDGGARYVWCHGLVWHVPPGMVLWWWLWKPDITTIPYRSEEDSNFLSMEPITLINHSYSLRTSFSVFVYPPSDVFHIPPS
jgi:hypothetical protein